jgi:hypothetical protein
MKIGGLLLPRLPPGIPLGSKMIVIMADVPQSLNAAMPKIYLFPSAGGREVIGISAVVPVTAAMMVKVSDPGAPMPR